MKPFRRRRDSLHSQTRPSQLPPHILSTYRVVVALAQEGVASDIRVKSLSMQGHILASPNSQLLEPVEAQEGQQEVLEEVFEEGL